MNLEELKSIADKKISDLEKMDELRKRAIGKYRIFKSICGELSLLIEEKISTYKTRLFDEFTEYFKNNDFELRTESNKIVADYKGLSIKLEDEYPDIKENDKVIALSIPANELYRGIVIMANRIDSDKLYWKRNLEYKSKHVQFDNFEEVIFSIKDLKDIENLISKIDDNIDWYSHTVSDFNEIKFVYSLYKTELEFSNFEELFKTL